VILGYVVLVGSRSAAFHAVGASAIALVLGFSLGVLLIFNYAYSGDLAVDSSPYRQGVLAQYFPPLTESSTRLVGATQVFEDRSTHVVARGTPTKSFGPEFA
jgi:hypothetical protein